MGNHRLLASYALRVLENKMQIFYTSEHSQHNPPEEIYDGVHSNYAETPDRIETIVRTLRENNYTTQEPQKFGIEHIEAVHQKQYIDFVSTRSAKLAADETLFPSYFMSDTYAPLVHGTFDAAKAAVDTALSGAQAVLDGTPAAYSLCRPPGHHAMHHAMGGYCYFNNAAIAAHFLSQHGRIAILDIDYHHGNGTQEVFYDRADVLYVSLHADPSDAYPYASGFSEENGRGEGLNATVNFPLKKSTTPEQYLKVLQEALFAVRTFSPDYLVISAGFDTFIDDPIGGLNLPAPSYKTIGSEIHKLALPTLIIQEGGYNISALGQLSSNFIKAFS